MAGLKVNPTLFDKLITDDRLADVFEEGRSSMGTMDPNTTLLRFRAAPQIERFNESALRATVRRELNWLLNTTNFAATTDLSPYPQVQSSVVNYGVPDLTGRVSTARAVQSRADEIREAITVFEPRIDAEKLSVEPHANIARDNAISFIIRGDVTSAVKAMPVEFVADVEVETGAAVVRE
jgi:type VI secretion system protein ImpF